MAHGLRPRQRRCARRSARARRRAHACSPRGGRPRRRRGCRSWGAGSRRVGCGGPRRVGQPGRCRQRGEPIQPAFMERGDDPWRGLVAPLRRRPRGLSWSRTRPQGKGWRVVSLSNGGRPPKSLRPGRTPRTPARARGLPDHVWRARESGSLPGPPEPAITKQRDARRPPARQAPPPGERREAHEKEAAPLPNAA